MTEELIKYFENFVTDKRKNRIREIIDFRTRYITVVLEDIYQPHNASAVLRTCDCFGIQDVHIIENKNEYEINPDVTLGSNKWLTLKKHNKSNYNSIEAIETLKKSGYRIVATTPHKKDVNLEEFDIYKGKFALLFGTELTGLSDLALEASDEFMKIPMFGFTESFNISVSAAIILHHLSQKLRKSDINWHLSKKEKNELILLGLKNTVKNPEGLEKEFFKNN